MLNNIYIYIYIYPIDVHKRIYPIELKTNYNL